MQTLMMNVVVGEGGNFGSFTFLFAVACRVWRKRKCAKMCGWVRWLFGLRLHCRLSCCLVLK